MRYRNQKLVTNAKVVSYETVTSQHRPLICTMKITPPNHKRAERCGPARMRWWRLREREAAVNSLIQLPPITNVDGTWQRATLQPLAYNSAPPNQVGGRSTEELGSGRRK
ncbi:hypothetical protein Y032_0031g2430 [Ancylostoma ceylanicum]|uniref:Uncharacterized protein n=1 Tax=Ancylostoma ceylanicum TaxID=53326 RepID=A0A016US98_9BILA|nr:hypothetical protein Y032_0031g2430 [Ancylostoma ceylanicum]